MLILRSGGATRVRLMVSEICTCFCGGSWFALVAVVVPRWALFVVAADEFGCWVVVLVAELLLGVPDWAAAGCWFCGAGVTASFFCSCCCDGAAVDLDLSGSFAPSALLREAAPLGSDWRCSCAFLRRASF